MFTVRFDCDVWVWVFDLHCVVVEAVCVCVCVCVCVSDKKWRLPADQLQEVTTSAYTDVLDEGQRKNGY